MGTAKTQKWLEKATGTPKTKKETEWFLVMRYTEHVSELTWKDQARELRDSIGSPPTYAGLERQFFEEMSGEEYEPEFVEQARRFYGLG